MALTMFDSVDVSTVPSSAGAVAGYVGGHWPTYAGLVQRFPGAHHLSIAVTSRQYARCLDVEPGDANNAQAPDWFRHYAIKTQGKPVLYTSASNVSSLIATMTAAGIPRSDYLIWSAHYSHEHICGPGSCGYPQADGTQWTDRALGRNLDQSLVENYFFDGVKPPPPKPPDPYANLTRGEKRFALGYDQERAKTKPSKYRLGLFELACRGLAHTIWVVAHKDRPPSWEVRHRGDRFQKLWKRANGKRVV